VSLFPPSGDWHQAAYSGSGTVTIDDTDINVWHGTVGGYRYAVNGTYDFSGIAYLSITWKSEWNIAYPTLKGNSTMFVGDNEFDNPYNYSSDRSFSISTGEFNTRTDYLDTSGIYGNKYIHVGGNMTYNGLVVIPLIDIYVYDIVAYNYSNSTTSNATNVEETSATLYSTLTNTTAGVSTTCGFWIGNVTTNATNFEQNITAGNYTVGQTFSTIATGLTSGEYYYVRSWTKGLYGFNASSTETYFLTKPTEPTNFIVTPGADNVQLSWDNATVGENTNLSVLIRYSTEVPVGVTPTWGTFGANVSNGSGNSTTISSLAEDTTFYFVAFTYINDSGSPSFMQFSDTYASQSTTTVGGVYEIVVKWENMTNGINYNVNLTEYALVNDYSRIVIWYTDEMDYISINRTGVFENTVSGYFDNVRNGNFSFTTEKEVLFLEFRWNEASGYNQTGRYCNRMLIPASRQRNVTFYILDRTVYGESSVYFNNSLVKYNYGFLDETGLYKAINDAYAFIYIFNSTGDRLTIHSEYFDSENKIHPWLLYDKKYFIGVGCDLQYRDRLGVAPTSTELSPSEIRISYEVNQTYNFFDVINLNYGWYNDGFYVDFIDTTSSCEAVTFYVYGIDNGTLMYREGPTAVSTKNFTFTTADGCNLSTNYRFNIIANLTSSDYDDSYELLSPYGVPIWAGTEAVTDNGTLDYWLQLIFGESPLYDSDNPNVFVPWTYILIFGFCFILLTTVGKLNAFLGGISVGITLVFSGIMISGVSPLFANYAGYEGAVLSVIGGFVLALSLIGLMGGVEK
jgi:hypothetical protein